MSFSGGVYTLPGPALATGEVVSATENNQFRNDVAGAFNLTFLRNGTATATANLPMGGYKLTGLGAATTSGDALSYGAAAVVTTLTSTSLTATRVPYAGTGGLLQDASTFTFDGTTLTAGGFTTSGAISAGTITASGAITVSGGTANGVAYLNGSKVLTTGSALTFNGSTLALSSGSVNIPDTYGYSFGGAQSAFIAGSSASSYIYMALGGSEQMRLTSTGLGIGTSSPGAKLHVKGAVNVVHIESTTSSVYQRFFNTGTTYSPYIGAENENTVFGKWGSGETMRLDSSGNLGLGVTPSATSVGKQFEVGFAGCSLLGASAANTVVGAGAIYNSGWLYAVSSTAVSVYQQQAGVHKWYTAPSGTAGNAITFTQAMTLDASGNLGIGTSSPASYGNLAVASGSGGATINIRNAGGAYYTAALKFSQASSSGDTRIQSEVGNDNLQFWTAATERMRIDSSGNLLVGTTSDPIGANAEYMFVANVNNGKGGIAIGNGGGTNATTAMRFYNSNGVVGSIITSGSSTAFNTSSDYRLKENIQPMQNALGVVAQLNPVTYTWKADGSDGQGFIAHELQAVVPDCVTGEKDAVDEEGKPVYQGIDTSFLTATLSKAIQELHEIVKSQAAEIAELKAKIA